MAVTGGSCSFEGVESRSFEGGESCSFEDGEVSILPLAFLIS